MNIRINMVLIIMMFGFLSLTGLSARDGYQNAATVNTHNEKEIIITIPERGWYSFQAESKTGTAIAVVDLMSGMLAQNGIPGRRDGYIDLLLEQGEYKIIFYPDQSPEQTHDNASDPETTLNIRQFEEQNGQSVLDFPFISGTEVIEIISRKISPFGRDSYLVSGDANFFQAIREEKSTHE